MVINYNNCEDVFIFSISTSLKSYPPLWYDQLFLSFFLVSSFGGARKWWAEMFILMALFCVF